MSLKRCTFEVIIPSLCHGSITDEPPEDINEAPEDPKAAFQNHMCVETQYFFEKTFTENTFGKMFQRLASLFKMRTITVVAQLHISCLHIFSRGK